MTIRGSIALHLILATYLLEETSLAELEELVERVQGSNVPGSSILGVSDVVKVQLTLLEQSDQLLGNLLHQDTVVSLGGHTGVGEGNKLTEAVDREIALTTATLAAGGGNALIVPGNKRLDDAAKTDNFIGIRRVLLQ